MIIERIIYNILTIILAIYIVRKYLSRNNNMYLAVLGGEVIAIIFNFLNLRESVYLKNYFIESVSAIFGVIIPGIIFIKDYNTYINNNIAKMLGTGQSIYEKGNVSDYYNQIPMFDAKEATDIIKWIKINEEDIFVQLKERFKKAESSLITNRQL